MTDPYVLRIAAERAEWLSQRQALIAGNVANANTPAYKARDLAAFSVRGAAGGLSLTTTQPAHLQVGGVEANSRVTDARSWEQTLSGNSVNLEQQMVNLGEVNRSYQLDMNIKRAIHQMMSAVLK